MNNREFMTTKEILTFDQCIEIANKTGGNKHLILGNVLVLLFSQKYLIIKS